MYKVVDNIDMHVILHVLLYTYVYFRNHVRVIFLKIKIIDVVVVVWKNVLTPLKNLSSLVIFTDELFFIT